MKSLLKEPLLHFLVLAIGMFLLHSAVTHDDVSDDAKRIVVDQESLMTFIQYRTKSFEPVTAKQQLESFSDEALKKVINDYVREEALYREASTLGLHLNDYVIKRRLIQKVDYIARGFAESFGEVTDEDIMKYFQENRNDYFIAPRITFTHVFFSSEHHGENEARMLAERKLEELLRTGAQFHEASRHGDRFLYGMNYVERSELFVESHFGPEMTGKLFGVEPDQGQWHGPFISSHGAHLVMVSQMQPGRMPLLDEIRPRVEQEAKRFLTEERSKEATQQIVDSYEVEIVYEKPEDRFAMLHKAGGDNE